MQRVSYGSVERAGWPVGPWEGEPDELDFIDTATKLRGAARRHPVMGSWQGFVLLPPAHRWHGRLPVIRLPLHYAYAWPEDPSLWAVGIDMAPQTERAMRWGHFRPMDCDSGPPRPYVTLAETVVAIEHLAQEIGW